MPANSSGSGQVPRSCSGVHGNGLADDEAIANKFADGLAGIGVRDFVHFVRIEPDLALAAANHGSCEALLRPEIDPIAH